MVAPREAARNGRYDRGPGLIARCSDPSDVVTCVEFAQAENLLLAVRGGGHGQAGHAMCDDGLVIDLSRMKDLEIDEDERTVRVQAGLRSFEVDTATTASGLAMVLPDWDGGVNPLLSRPPGGSKAFGTPWHPTRKGHT